MPGERTDQQRSPGGHGEIAQGVDYGHRPRQLDVSQGKLGSLIQAAQKEVLDSYRKEFDQLSTAFRDLDSKAQGTATVAGAFLAASLAYLNRQGSLSTALAHTLMSVAVLGLIGAITFSIRALGIRKLVSVPSGEDVEDLLRSLGQNARAEDLEERLTYFYGDTAKLWKQCISDRRNVNQEKADFIWSAQRSLMLTALAVTCLILITVLTS